MTAVLWICGAPGVGKSVTAWELFTTYADPPARVSYVDVDQLGMLYPDSEDDPEGTALKQQALVAVRANYAHAGSGVLVVSGVLDPAYSVENAFHCLLTTQPSTLRQRILERGWTSQDADEAVAEQQALTAAGFADEVVDTTHLSPAEVAHRVRLSFTGQPQGGATGAASALPPSGGATCPILVINGPRGVGCSTVSFALAQRRWHAGVPTGFLDLEQISFARGSGISGHIDLGLGLANVATMAQVFSGRGAHGVVVNGHLTTADGLDHLRQVADTKVVRLRADARTIADHLLDRRGGNAARLAGDDLAHTDPDRRKAVLSVALEQQERLEEMGAEDLVVDVSGGSADDVVEEIQAWLGSP